MYAAQTTLEPFHTTEERDWYDARGETQHTDASPVQMHDYQFHLGQNKFPKKRDDMHLICIAAIPAALLSTVQEHFKKPSRMGQSTYTVRTEPGKKVALRLQNQPKGWNEKFGKATKGFGSLLELIPTRHLVAKDVTHVGSSFYRTDAAKRQVPESPREVPMEEREQHLIEQVRKKIGEETLAEFERAIQWV